MPEQHDPVIDWLTSLQSMQARLQDTADAGDRNAQAAAEQNDEYSVSDSNQQGEKGNPAYAGTDTAVRARFWQWPQWDKESFYFIGNKGLAARSYVRFRLYYDKFNNLIKAYDNATYTTQTLPSSFTS